MGADVTRSIRFAWRSLRFTAGAVILGCAVGLVVAGLLPAAALAQSNDPVAALGGAGAGSLLGSFIGAAVGSWRAVRKGWDEETTAKVRNLLADELLRHQLACQATHAGLPGAKP